MPAPPAVEPFGVQPLDHLEDLAFIDHLRRLSAACAPAGVSDDADSVVGPQGVDEHAERVLEQRQSVIGCH